MQTWTLIIFLWFGTAPTPAVITLPEVVNYEFCKMYGESKIKWYLQMKGLNAKKAIYACESYLSLPVDFKK